MKQKDSDFVLIKNCTKNLTNDVLGLPMRSGGQSAPRSRRAV